MTQRDKELLLKDLSARLPYEVIVQVKDWTILDTELKTGHIRLFQDDYLELKPFLRPMSSMTEEEKKEYDALFTIHSDGETYCENWEWMDWMNAHQFDYRKDDEGKTMIEKGLASVAPEGMYKTK